LLDVLDLGMRDRSPEVQRWALVYLRQVAFQDFAEDFQAYQAWYQANRRKPVTKVIAESIHRFAAEAAAAQGKEALKRAQLLSETRVVFRDVPAARRAAADSGLLKVLGRWAAAGAAAGARPDDIKLAEQALGVIARLNPGQAYLRRVVVPLLARDKSLSVRTAAISSLGSKDNAWAVDLLLDVLKGSLAENKQNFDQVVVATASALGDMDDPRAIPTLIALIEADNTKVYWVGHFGLGRLTGVRYDEGHNGAWWRQWWARNKARYPEAVRRLEIPRLGKNLKPADPLADVADVPAQDLRAGGDARKRYFLIGARKGAKPPAGGYGLLIVLPGDDGGAKFHPFLRRLYKNVLNDRWLIVQAVAPQWDEKQFNQVTWPRAGLRYPAAKFTTEQFIDALLADVKAKVPIDRKRVFLLGWSSGGPPCYSLALRKDSPITGAFIAMSVFHKPELALALKNARGRTFYLLQSPDDEVTEFRFAEAAEKVLRAAGARVKLQSYKGGHGWHGDVWGMIAEGLAWLEKQGGAKP
jgi:predicted esterase/HEAT repeat protein